MKFRILLLLFTLKFFSVSAQSADARLLEHFNSGFHPGPDKAWRFVSDVSGPIDFGAPVTIFFIGLARGDKDLEMKAYETGASLLIAAGSGLVLKEIVRRDRPFVKFPGIFFKKQNESGYSFPSNHTSLAFATATSLSLAFPRWYVIAPSFVFATATGYSRLYLGVHYPSDVLAGAIIGAGSAFLSRELQRILERNSLKHHKLAR